MKALLGVDLGTSVYKAVAITADGQTLASGKVRAHYQRPAPGRVQFSAPGQFERLCRLIRTVAAELPRGASPVALCLSGASGNTLLLDSRHRPLAPAISWLDIRPGEGFQSLLPEIRPEEVLEVVGWPWTERFPLSQLAWLRRHQSRLYRKARYFTLDTAYYYHELTGRMAIDHSSATTLYLQDQKNRRWHDPFLRSLDIEPSSLPELVFSGAPIGGLTAKAARAAGLPIGLPVIAGCFDQASAAFGSGVLRPGDLLLSCGTSWVGFFPTADRASALAAGLIVVPFQQSAAPWGAMFSLTAIGTTIDRYLSEVFPFPKSLCLAERYRRFAAAAATIRCGQEGPPIDPLAGLPAGRAAAARVRANTSLAQLSRRLMCGTALAMRRRLAAATADGFKSRRVIMVGGPSTSAVWTRIVADTLGRELSIADGPTAGAMGAALLAGIGVGVFRDASEAVRRNRRSMTRVPPEPSTQAWYAGFS